MYAIPNTADMVKQSQVPISLSISPLAKLRPDEVRPAPVPSTEHKVRIAFAGISFSMNHHSRISVNWDPSVVTVARLTCVRTCNSSMVANDSSAVSAKPPLTVRSWFLDWSHHQSFVLVVPTEYFNHLDHSGRRMDYYQRPELCLGAYEIPATKKYCKVSRSIGKKPRSQNGVSRTKNGPNHRHSSSWLMFHTTAFAVVSSIIFVKFWRMIYSIICQSNRRFLVCLANSSKPFSRWTTEIPVYPHRTSVLVSPHSISKSTFTISE